MPLFDNTRQADGSDRKVSNVAEFAELIPRSTLALVAMERKAVSTPAPPETP